MSATRWVVDQDTAPIPQGTELESPGDVQAGTTGSSKSQTNSVNPVVLQASIAAAEGESITIIQPSSPTRTTTTTPPTKSRLKLLFSRLPPVVTLLASRRLLAALFASIVQASLIAAFDFILPIFVNETFGWGSLQSGLLYLTIVIPSLASPIVGYYSDKYGGRLFSAVGFLLACPLFVLLRLVTHNSLSQKIILIVFLVIIGFAMTLIFPPIMAEITHIVIAKEESKPKGAFGKGGAYAQAYGLFNMAFAAGTLVGPIWSGLIKQNYGWNTMSWTLGLLSGVTAVPCLVWVDGSLRKRKRKLFSKRYQAESSDRGL